MKRVLVILLVLFLGAGGFYYFSKAGNPIKTVGEQIDQFNGVSVYYNGGVGNVEGRNLAPDGYNLGLKYQCVEFVKRYYYEHLDHKMPNSYGHAKDFFDNLVGDGKRNTDRNLIQYINGSSTKPRVNDLLIFKATKFNQYGHVAIISAVSDVNIEIIQQNPGVSAASRENFKLQKLSGKWSIKNKRVLGWLSKE